MTFGQIEANMPNWTAELMTDPARDHAPVVELLEDMFSRGRIFQDEAGALVFQLYEKPLSPIPADWLRGIIERFSDELKVR
jgi:hypothetical protein